MGRPEQFGKLMRLRIDREMDAAIRRLARRHRINLASAMRLAMTRGLEDLGEMQRPPTYAKDAA